MKHTGDDLQKVRETVTSLVKEHGGEITLDDIFAKQKLAYPIKKVHQGTYVVMEFDIEKDKINTVEKLLHLNNDLLRYMLIKKKVKTAAELERENSIQERLLKQKEDELAALEGELKAKPVAEEKKAEAKEDVVAVAPAKEEVKEEKEAPVAKKETKEIELDEKEEKVAPKKEEKKKDDEIKQKAPKSKISLDDLDKKLDEILTDDIL